MVSAREKNLSIEEIIELFDTKRLSKSPSMFDKNKLKFINHEYIKKLSQDEFIKLIRPFLKEANIEIESEEWLNDFAELLKDRCEYGSQIVDLHKEFFSVDFVLEDKAKEFILNEETALPTIKEFKRLLKTSDFTKEDIANVIKQTGKNANVKGRNLFMPCRISTTGTMHGPDLPKSLALLGKEIVLSRIENIIEILEDKNEKINLLITSLLLALLLTACGKKMVAKVTIDEMNVTRETLSLEFSVDDPKKQISLGTLEGKLYYKDNLINSYTPTKVDDTDFTYKITATNLSINHEYTIKVVAIANKRSVELLNKTFRTKHEGSSSANPIYIHTIEDFMDMENDNYAYYELVNDLDFTDYDFVAPFQTKTFQGSFDGKEKTLKNIKIDTRSTYVGIWGRNAGTIKNLNVENINVSLLGTSQSSQYISILAARNSGTIENVNIKSSSINTNFSHSGVVRMGGVSAYSESGSKIIGATVDIDYDIQAISRSEFYIGGIVGELNGASLKESKSKTNIAMDNSTTAYIGGAVGQMNFSTLNESSAKESESELEINIKTTVERVVSNDKTVAISIGGFVGRAVKANFTDIYAKRM